MHWLLQWPLNLLVAVLADSIPDYRCDKAAVVLTSITTGCCYSKCTGQWQMFVSDDAVMHRQDHDHGQAWVGSHGMLTSCVSQRDKLHVALLQSAAVL